jgi:hypothetical protein
MYVCFIIIRTNSDIYLNISSQLVFILYTPCTFFRMETDLLDFILISGFKELTSQRWS